MDPKKCKICNVVHKNRFYCIFRALRRVSEQALQNPVQVVPVAEKAPRPTFYRPWEQETNEAGRSFQGSQAAVKRLEILNQGQAGRPHHSLLPAIDYFTGQPLFYDSQNAFPFIPNPWFPQNNGARRMMFQHMAFQRPLQHGLRFPRAQLLSPSYPHGVSQNVAANEEHHQASRTGEEHADEVEIGELPKPPCPLRRCLFRQAANRSHLRSHIRKSHTTYGPCLVLGCRFYFEINEQGERRRNDQCDKNHRGLVKCRLCRSTYDNMDLLKSHICRRNP
ncbi:Hypothetical predicted protein [Cloeon dipterum]|uniref:Uncharacterized protein n=1 Tax=Cloeon dipterum TaxID=197152 RepID=A0A8S1DJ38_9INSE|nr:Hypothetical predicted protein [Cloeon dipterum]